MNISKIDLYYFSSCGMAFNNSFHVISYFKTTIRVVFQSSIRRNLWMESRICVFIVKLKLYDDVSLQVAYRGIRETVKCLWLQPMVPQAAKTSAETGQSRRRMQMRNLLQQELNVN